jgi:phospholipase C
MWWVTDVVNNVMQSKYWQNTAIIVLWDEYGGFFDTLTPPTVDGNGLSFRVPALIISPYAKAGYIDHTVYDFESTLKFIEWRFGLPTLTQRDAGANNLLNAFDFGQQPAIPHIIPLTKVQLTNLHPFIVEGSQFNPNPGGTGSLAFIKNEPDYSRLNWPIRSLDGLLRSALGAEGGGEDELGPESYSVPSVTSIRHSNGSTRRQRP